VKTLTQTLLVTALLAAAGPCAAQTVPSGGNEAAANKPADPPRAARKAEKLELGTTTITGNRELPKVMYIVPWKHPEAGDLRGKPMQSLVDEALAPVDREVFNREISYFRALQASRDAGVETSVTASEPAP
jgi:hypothetical protein